MNTLRQSYGSKLPVRNEALVDLTLALDICGNLIDLAESTGQQRVWQALHHGAAVRQRKGLIPPVLMFYRF